MEIILEDEINAEAKDQENDSDNANDEEGMPIISWEDEPTPEHAHTRIRKFIDVDGIKKFADRDGIIQIIGDANATKNEWNDQ